MFLGRLFPICIKLKTFHDIYSLLILDPLSKYDIEIPINSRLRSGKHFLYHAMIEKDSPIQICIDRSRI